MKRKLWAALGVVVVALAVPTAALATHHHNSRHRGHAHGRVHYGPTGSTGATGSNSVFSYSNGTLVLTLGAGGSITGTVSDQTRFECVGSGFYGGRGGRGHGGRYDWHRESRGGSSGSTGWTGSTGSTGWTGSTGSTGWTGSTGSTGYTGSGGRWTPRPPCDSSLLVGGAVVSSAEVQIGPNGVLFSEISLLPAVQ